MWRDQQEAGIRSLKGNLPPVLSVPRKHLPDQLAVYPCSGFGMPAQCSNNNIDSGIWHDRPFDQLPLFKPTRGLDTMAGRDIDLANLANISTVTHTRVISDGGLICGDDPSRCKNVGVELAPKRCRQRNSP